MTTRRSRPRLLLVAETLAGGLGAVVGEQCAWFSAEGWDVTVASPGDAAVSDQITDHVRVPIPQTARQVLPMARAARQLRRVIRRRQPDVIHAHGLRSFLVARLASAHPTYVTLHGTGPVPSDPSGYKVFRELGLRVTPYLAAHAFDTEPEGRSGWTFVAHASPRLAHLDRRLFPGPETEPTFLWIGRLSEQKRPDMFVEAMAAAGRQKEIRGLIAGDGPLRGEVERHITELRAPVEVVGHTDDIADLLDHAWAVVLFSRFEGMPLVVEEAMWAGRPVVSSPHPGVRWLIGNAGFTADDVEAATTSILRLTDHDVAAGMGVAAAERIRQLLVPGAPWPEVAAIYRRRVPAG
jgi:glycosyltransferase involved in cell wall biosynthesis